MKFRIQHKLEISRLKEIVPTAYRELASALEPTIEGPVTLITFPHDRRDVVKSSLVVKALKKLNPDTGGNLVALGGCFSLESVELLQNVNALLLCLSEFNWSDERHTAIKSGEAKSIDKP